MDMQTLKEFFGWMTLINLILYVWTVIMCITCRQLFTRLSGRMFGMGETATNTILYAYVASYKLLLIVFNLVPWLTLVIMTR